MIDDIRRALDEAAEAGSDRPFRQTTYAAMARGRRYRRRRTALAAGGTTAVAAVVLGALALGFSSLPGSDRSDGTEPPVVGHDASSRYERVPVSAAEVVNRCGPQLENSVQMALPVVDGDEWRMDPIDFGQPHQWRISPWWKENEPNWRDELIVGGKPHLETYIDGEWQDGECVVPEADLAADSGRIQGEPVEADDIEGVLRQCGELAGYDFSRWQVVSAMSASNGVEAMLRSTNDHSVRCTIESVDDLYFTPSVEFDPRRDPAASCVILANERTLPEVDMSPYEGDGVYAGSGTIYRHDGTPALNIAELRFELPDGSVVTQAVHEATWAVRFAHEVPAGGPVPVAMLDANGDVVAERDNALGDNC